jgi:hypothetical protein
VTAALVWLAVAWAMAACDGQRAVDSIAAPSGAGAAGAGGGAGGQASGGECPHAPAEGVRTVFKGSFANVPAEVAYVANVHDLHVLSSGPAKVQAIHDANPAAVVYRYQKIAGLHGPQTGPDPGWDQVVAQGLLWKGPKGEPVKQTQHGWYYIDIGSPQKRKAWLEILLTNITAELAKGYDGVFLDNSGVIDPSLIDDMPSDYQDGSYYAAIADVLAQLRAKLPGRKTLINSYTGGAPEGFRGMELLTNCDGIFFEAFSTKYVGTFFEPARYRQQLTDFREALARDKIAVAMDYAAATDMQRRMWSLASYLLVNGPGAHHLFAGKVGHDLQQYPEDSLAIGIAECEMAALPSGLYARSYSGGVVLVNALATAVEHELGPGSWQLLGLTGGGAFPSEGTIAWNEIGEKITIAPNHAAIVRRVK